MIRQRAVIVVNPAKSLMGIVVLNFGSDPVEHGDAIVARNRFRRRSPFQREQEENVECAVAGHDVACIAQSRLLVRKGQPASVIVTESGIDTGLGREVRFHQDHTKRDSQRVRMAKPSVHFIEIGRIDCLSAVVAKGRLLLALCIDL